MDQTNEALGKENLEWNGLVTHARNGFKQRLSSIRVQFQYKDSQLMS